MKIAISELEPSQYDLDSAAGREIIGGKTSINLAAEAIAEGGDFNFTRIETGGWKFQFKTDKGTFDVTLGGQLAAAVTFEAA